MTRRFLIFVVFALSLSVARRAPANPRETVPGSFYFYDPTLNARPDNPQAGIATGQAEMIECQGHSELFEWGDAPYKARCLRFTPRKVGDSITFRIHIEKVATHSPCRVQTAAAYFNNEGIYQLLVDGEIAGPEHDCFQHDKWTHGQWPVDEGDYKITYRYIGKNPESAGSVLNLMRLEFTPAE